MTPRARPALQSRVPLVAASASVSSPGPRLVGRSQVDALVAEGGPAFRLAVHSAACPWCREALREDDGSAGTRGRILTGLCHAGRGLYHEAETQFQEAAAPKGGAS